MDAREFPLGVVLTGSTGVMLCRGDFGEFHEFSEFMTGGPVWTHELLTLAPILKAEILRQHPDLPTEADVSPETFHAWLDRAEEQYGATRELTPIPDYARTKGPIQTAVEVMSR